MSAIVAIFQRHGQPVTTAAMDALLAAAPHRAVDGQDTWYQGPVALAHQHFDLTPEGHAAPQPVRNPAGTLTLTADVRLDNRAELIRTLGLDPAGQPSDAALILAAYTRWGTACVTHLLGDFAFALWDDSQQHLFIARDPLGCADLACYLDEQLCVIASEVNQVIAHPAIPRRLNDLKIAMILVSWWHDHEQTVFENVYYVPPAHALVITAGSVRRWRYWDIDPGRRLRYKNDDEYADHLRELITSAVRDRLRVTGRVGISMSGGIDSLTMAILATEQLPPGRVDTFTYVFDQFPECDERAYIRPVVDQYNLNAHFLLSDHRWTLSDFATWPVSPDFPVADAFVRLPLAVADAARANNCQLLLNGHYADILLAGGHGWPADLLRRGHWGTLTRRLWQQRAHLHWRHDVLDWGLQAALPPAVLRLRRLRQGRPLRHLYTAHLAPDLPQRTRLGDYLDTGAGRPAFDSLARLRQYNHLLLAATAQGRAVARQRYHAYGLAYADPFLDRRLVEFAVAVPLEQLMRPPHTKYVLRRAMTGHMPDHVVWRRDKTTFRRLIQVGLLDKERDKVRQLLTHPRIVEMGYVSAAWLQQELMNGSSWHGDGYQFWLCLALEIWLRHRAHCAGPAFG